MLKKLFLILLFLLLVIFSILAFDYNKFLNNDVVKTTSYSLLELKSLVKENFNTFKTKFIKKEQKEQIVQKPVIIEIIKDNNNIIMNGVFKDEIQAKNISDILHINREGQYKFDSQIVLSELFLQKISKLILPFKDFFLNNSTLSINGEKVALKGELKNKKFKDILETTINNLDIDIESNIKYSKNDINSNDKDSASEQAQINTEIEAKKEEIIQKEQLIPNTNLKTELQKIQDQINDVLKEEKITFKRRSTSITHKSFESVKKIVKILKINKKVKVEIGGHTDSRGKDSLNKRISQNRANKIKKVLVDMGIKKSRLTAVGYGEDFPIAKDDKDGLSQINRRVEFKILGE